MEGYSKKEVSEYMSNFLNRDRKYTIKHKYQSACDGKERLVVEEV